MPRNTCSTSFNSPAAHQGDGDPSERGITVAYVVSCWPRLSQTFVLNEIAALEKRGMHLRIFSVKNPGNEPVHAKVFGVAAKVAYLSLKKHWQAVIRAHLEVARKAPARYLRTLFRALRYGRMGVLRGFLRGGYLAGEERERQHHSCNRTDVAERRTHAG